MLPRCLRVLATGFLLLAASAAGALAERNLFTPAAEMGRGVVRVDLAALSDLATLIPLPDRAVRADRQRVLVRGARDYTWVGRLDDGTAVLVVRDGAVTGSLQVGTEHYMLTPAGNGLARLERVNPADFPRDHPSTVREGRGGDVSGGTLSGTTATAAADGQVYVDVLIAWTAAARASYSGDMQAYAQLTIDTANVAYANSGVNVVMRLAGTTEVAYAETTFDQALDDLTYGRNGMAAVQSARDAAGADVVSLLINDSSYCGLGWVNSSASTAFSVVARSCAVSNYSFSHEVGHNFGARHDPYVDASTSPYAWGHGYVYGKAWRTIMAYANACGSCPRLQYFSSPLVSYGGVPMGTADTNDNARVHRDRATAVASFRTAVGESYVLSLNKTPSLGGAVSGAGTYPKGATVQASANAYTGYAFDNWTDETGALASVDPTLAVTLSSNRTLTANFHAVAVTYTVTLGAKPGAGGTVAGAGTFVAGATCTVTAAPAAGYSFAGWMEGTKVVSTQLTYAFPVTGNRTLAASFKKVRR